MDAKFRRHYIFVRIIGRCIIGVLCGFIHPSAGLVVNAFDSGSRGRGFEPHSGCCVLEQGTFTPQKHW